MKKFAIISLIAALLTLTAEWAARLPAEAAAQPTLIRFGVIFHTSQGLNGPYARMARKFADLVEQRSHGRLKVEIFDVAKISDFKKMQEKEVLARLVRNEIQMCDARTSGMSEYYVNQMRMFDMPYLFKDYRQCERVIEGPIGQDMFKQLLPHNIRGLAWTYSGGFRVLLANRAIRSMADMKGLRVQVHSTLLADQYRAWGASPLMGFIELIGNFAAEGTLDATDSTYNYARGMIFKYLNEPHATVFTTMVLINNKFMTSLPRDLQEIIARTAHDTGAWERKVTIADNEQIRAMLRKRGVQVVTLSPDQQRILEQAARPTYDRYAALIGWDLVKKIAALASTPSGSTGQTSHR